MSGMTSWFYQSILLCSSISLLITSAKAADPNGLCIPADACMGVQKKILANAWDECESTCTLRNPVAVRNMDATLYDVDCSGDWGERTSRVLFARTKESNQSGQIIMLTSNGVQELEYCQR